ncbi:MULTISPECIES: OmpA/MotB family protein [unclassified Halomonas]|uniref:OmpA/MotB family protein n=1 Tax=unclassified Halomonas TaxID=2609666 RepID=UPI0006DA67E8|nr:MULTISPECIES: OmpA family protein [unclassified Halomonas]KPQ18792.1 MAG: chemotaxis protein MotB [Halomonas sp. HL-93]SBR52295.1 chemotaxis protein MotB [Halomonas sp. HL-93]SNY98080.1 chemotaxis protein MotB [Halomonas sp. hl-4]
MLDRDTRQTLEAPLLTGGEDDGWLTSYLDVLTLLLTLFVLLLSLAPPGGNDEGAAGSVAEVSPGAIEDLPLATLAAGIQPRHSGVQPRFDGIRIPGVDVSQGQEGVTLRINDRLLFDSGRAQLTGQGRDLIASLVDVLNAFEGQVSVEGHTDNVPIATSRFPSNWELSSARSIAVVRHLESQGLNVDRMRAVGYADTQPIENNATSQGRAANRRVELVLRQPSARE